MTLVFVSCQSAAADISDASGKRPYQSLGYGTTDHANRLSLAPERRFAFVLASACVIAMS